MSETDAQEAASRERNNNRTVVFRILMSEPAGRRFIWLELSEANVFSSTYFPGDTFDMTSWREGKRAHGLAWNNEISSLCPEQYMLMVRENSAAVPHLKKETEDE